MHFIDSISIEQPHFRVFTLLLLDFSHLHLKDAGRLKSDLPPRRNLSKETAEVAIPPVDTSGILARRDAVLAASSGASAVPAGRAVSAAAAAGVAATEAAAAPKKALAVVAQPAGTAPTAVAKSAGMFI